MSDVFKGTVIAEIEELALSGDFSSLVLKYPKREDDKVIGMLTTLEKAIFTLVDRKSKEFNNFYLEVREICADCDHRQEEETCPHHLQALDRQAQIDFLDALSWTLIKARLKIRNGNYALRQNFEIVEISDEEAFQLQRQRY